ncbi:MAG: DUF305 domain-containing protein [Actinomycetota bacterium]|nr:DUF305 domain-containing protein [Actinomycetota bacterium]
MSMFLVGCRLRLLSVGLTAAFVLAACAEAGPAPKSRQGGGSETRGQAVEFNEADVDFLQGVIAHDQRTAELAALAADRSNRRELADFASRVVAVRQEEAARARGLLSDAGQLSDGQGHPPWTGGVSEEELQALRARGGAEFERSFVHLLARHQSAAVTAAEDALERGSHPRVAGVAAQLITGQQAEVAQLHAWQQQWWPPLGQVAPVGLGPGNRGPEVLALEKRLDALRYDVGAVDGIFDSTTAFAVVAFQKIAGLPRTRRATPDVVARLESAVVPDPLVPEGGATRVEIDLPRQVLFLYQGDALHKILPISSGTGKRYCDKGKCGIAKTPAGAYRVTWRDDGWRESDLGRLYNPVYFIDRLGIAIHGHPSVPASPASHGCVRIPMSAAEWFPDLVPRATAVYVLDGATPVGPLPPVAPHPPGPATLPGA